MSDTVAEEARPLLVVGLGASAGGIQALKAFFGSMPPDSALAYVVILHLSPDYDSQLSEVLQGMTEMPVRRVSETTPLHADHVYVISPNTSLRMIDGMLTVSDSPRPEERRAPIDIFFRTLSEAHGERAVGVVLSGTGSDGSSGLKQVKEHGGLTLAQDPAEAEYDDMPRNAIATGLVDRVLPIGAIPQALLDYRRYQESAPTAKALQLDIPADHLREVLAVLRVRTGHDFSQYKTATVLRRIDRRRHLHGLADIEGYARLLRDQPEEAAALLRELLISVTHFFRDPAAFTTLEQRVIPRLFDHRWGSDQIRVWVAGCATGEEAYSVAMLLAEAAEGTDAPPIQIFATDLDLRAITDARIASYTQAEVADVSPERLVRFFTREAGGYRVKRELREMVLFAHHNVLRDPPFSHIDLVCCRNLLIYLNRGAQDRLLETFLFALRPGRYLFLGTSESVESSRALFVAVDREARIFESRSAVPRPFLPSAVREPMVLPPVTSATVVERPSPQPLERLAASDLHLQLLEQFAPPSVIVTEDYTVLHVSERAGRFLRVAAGEPSRDVLKLVLPELRVELRAALSQAARGRVTVRVRGVQVPREGGAAPIDLEVRQVLREGSPPHGFFVILFDDVTAQPAGPESIVAVPARPPGDTDAVWQIEDELTRVSAQLRDTIEQYETQVEEARASNEELQAVNEELRSSAEELETSKEELQSVNEELTTVNQELKIKIDELGAANNDFQNLINSTDIATLFVDRALRLKMATPRARDVFNLLPQDVGRPLTDITTALVYDRLRADIEAVFHNLQTIERELQATGGAWFQMRILPYRTTDARIEGVVLTFQDVTTRRHAESAVRESEERLRLLIDSVQDYAIFTLDSRGLVASWNVGAERTFGYVGAEIIGREFDLLFTPEDRAAGAPQAELAQARAVGRAEDERWHMRRDGSRLYCSGVTTLLGDSDTRGFAKVARDLTQARHAQAALVSAHEDLEDHVRHRTAELQREVEERIAAEQRATDLVRRLVTAQEDERARVARDIHDQVGQQMTALRLSLERLHDRCDEAANAEVAKAMTIAREIDGGLEFLAWELRPAALDDLGLHTAVARYLRTWSDHMGIPAEIRTAGGGEGRLDAETEIAFYRIAQEALNNIAKHAHATRVDVILEQRDHALLLVIEDDGVGFDTADASLERKGLGLSGMRERAALADATVQIESTPGQGTTVFLRKPGPGAAS